MRHSELQTFFRNVRKRHHITQTVMANRLGVTQPLLSFYENGKINIPNNVIIGLKTNFNLKSEEIEFLQRNKISKSNLRAIEVLEQVKEQLLNNKQFINEFIEEKINELKR